MMSIRVFFPYSFWWLVPACFLGLVLLLASTQVAAQSFYPFTTEVAQASYTQPALIPEHPYRFSVGLPGLGQAQARYYNQALAVNDILERQGEETIIDPGLILPQLARQNLLSAQASVDLLHIRYRLTEDQWLGFYVRERLESHLLLSNALFKFLWKGSGAFIDGPGRNKVDFRKTGINAQHFREYAINYSRRLNGSWDVGGSLGLLFGKASAHTTRSNTQLQIEADSAFAWDLQTNSELQWSPGHASDSLLSESGYWWNNDNPGVSLNLGARYRLSDQWEFAAAVNDLGFIRWNDRPQRRMLGRTRFTGLALERYLDSLEADNLSFQQVRDTLAEDFALEEDSSSYTTALVSKTWLAAQYQLNERWLLGAALQGIIFRGLHPRAALNAQYQLAPSLALHATYEAADNSYDNLGAGLVWTSFPVQVYAQTSNIPASWAPFNAQTVQLSAGVNLMLGRPPKPDADQDGVPDEDDACPYRSGLERFQGCPDTDGDSIPDTEDACPRRPGSPKFQGCPDSDGDGVSDRQDRCPQTAGIEAFKGCPDTDGDSIPDPKDRCPEQSGEAALQGCPDRDQDGIADPDDRCPDEAGLDSLSGCPFSDQDGDSIPDVRDDCPERPGTVATQGCPDADADGVRDALDVCPREAGLPANDGCPEQPEPEQVPKTVASSGKKTSEEEQKLLAEAARNIQFEVNSARLKPSSRAYLDELFRLLREDMRTRLLIEGFTDNRGTDVENRQLSRERARTVKTYLVNAGISSWRLLVVGHGSKLPLGNNNTEDGRQKNRRVELHLIR